MTVAGRPSARSATPPSRMPSSVLPVAVGPATTMSGGGARHRPHTARPMPFPHVFEPLTLRHRTLTSRITFGAHTANMAEGGLPGDRHIGYYRERALGGAGMIVVEPVPVHRDRGPDAWQLPARRRRHRPGIPAADRRLPRRQPRRRDDPAAVSRRPARRRRQLVRPELVAVGAALLPRRGWQPRDDRGRDRRGHRRLRRRRATARRTPASTASSCSRPTTRSSTSSGRRGRTGAPTRGAARSRRGCGSRATVLERIRGACGDDFIIGLAVSVDERPSRRCRSTSCAEIVAWHDERRADGLRHLRHRLVLRLLPDHPGVAVRAAARRPVRRRAQARRARTPSSRPRATSARPQAAEAVIAAGEADMVSIVRGPDRRPAPRRQGPRRPRRRGPAVHLVQPAVLGSSIARLLDLVPREPVGRPGVPVGRRPLRAAPRRRGPCWSSAAGRPGWRRRGSPPSAAIG